ncbi:MAG: hypothetical protein AB1499_15395 [Nitrospirota bacterium]
MHNRRREMIDRPFLKKIKAGLRDVLLELVVSVLLIFVILGTFMATGLYDEWVLWVARIL